jgi:hypothetical protein
VFRVGSRTGKRERRDKYDFRGISIFKKTENMKILKCILFCMLFAAFSCRDNNIPDIPIPLNGTKWKLAGVVNAKTYILKEFEPRACTECFTLMFDTDHEASGRSISSKIKIDLLDLRKYMLTEESETWIEHPSLPVDGDRFRGIMASIESFTVTPEELKLYFNNKTEYLLFKRDNSPSDALVSLNGTKWKLAGSVDAETGKLLKEFQPKFCAECFTLTFDTDYEASGRSISSRIKIDLLDLRKYMMTLELEIWIENPDLPVDGGHFREIMASIDSFTVASEELRLYYNDNTEYLLFRRIQP